MASERVGDMTLEELNIFVERAIVRHQNRVPEIKDSRSVEEILDSIDRHMWTPPPGAKSSLELLREDRDR